MLIASLDRILSGRISGGAFAAGARAYQRGERAKARRYLRIAAAAAPRNAGLCTSAAQAALAAQDAEMALAMLDAASRLEPGDFPLAARAIALRHALGDAAGALRRCEDALSRSAGRDPGNELMSLLAGLRMPGPNYLQVLAAIHAELRPATYLETGVSRGDSLALATSATHAIGIDPVPRIGVALPPHTAVYPETSDDFFARRDVRALLGGRPVELGFIDGMHLFEFALRDFINLERCCAPHSTILVHDCYPLDRASAERERRTQFWTGDIWRFLLVLKKYRPDLRLATVATPPSGLCVVRGLDPESRVLAERYDAIVAEFKAVDFGVLAADQAGALNLAGNDAQTLRRLLH